MPLYIRKNLSLLFLTPIIIFILYLSTLTTFNQNDDWVYTLNVRTFLQGDFSLHWYIGPSFLAQGLIGTVFAYLFSADKLPILTGLFTATNVILLYSYIDKRFGLDNLTRLCIVALNVFNPLFIYSGIGFMTEQYFLFILLISQVFVDNFLETKHVRSFVFLALITFIGVNIRQVTLVIPLALAIYLTLTKDFRRALLSFGWFCSLYIYIETLFPKTQRMFETHYAYII